MATQCTVQPEKQHFKEVHCVPLRASQSDSRVFRRLLGRGWLRWFAHPSSGAVCRACLAFALDTLCLLPALQKWQLDILVFLYLAVQNLPQRHTHSYFCLFQFRPVLLLQKTLVQVLALQQRVPGSSLSQNHTL